MDQTFTTEHLKLDPVWREAARVACEMFGYGDMIPHAWLMQALEIDTPEGPIAPSDYEAFSFERLRKVEAFRDTMLIEHQRYLLNVRGQGYRIVEPPQQTDAAMGRCLRQVGKALASAMNAVTNINEAMLSLEDARENADARAKLAWLRTMGLSRIEHKPDDETQDGG